MGVDLGDVHLVSHGDARVLAAAALRVGLTLVAIVALGAMRISLSGGERDLLKRLYRNECGSRDCEPFSRAIADAFGSAKR